MLRLLRITGILFFALMIGFSANNVWRMHESGELFEKYNSRRKANVTILAASILAVGILGAFEFAKNRRAAQKRGFGGSHYEAGGEESEEMDVTNIYASPATRDPWGRRRGGSGRHGYKNTLDLAVVWMVFLRIFSLVLPMFYIVLLAGHLMQGYTPDFEYWLVVGTFGFMAVFAFITAYGLCLKKTWGYGCGYVVAIFNLVVFPIGTVLGLVLLVGLVGSAPLFAVSEKKQRRALRKKMARKKKHAAS